MNKKLLLLFASVITIYQTTSTMAPLGLIDPYDINIKFKRPAKHNAYFGVLGEKSYNVKGYTTDACEEETLLVNPLQIYEEKQNWLSLYQGFDKEGKVIENRTTPFTQLVDSITGGPGGGASNATDALFTPTGKFCAGQAAFSALYGIDHGIYLSAHLPIYFVKLHCVDWEYCGNNTLFSGEKIQKELIDTFTQDAQEQFNLDITGWKKRGPGDLTLMIEWQRDFPQRREVLKSVQPNLRLGLSFPTGVKSDENVIMPVPFGADGAFTLPFGGGLGINLANRVEVGFSGQFWYYFGNQKLRRVKTFPTQTSLLLPATVETYKDHAFLQNFNLYAQAFSFCKRFSVKMCYQYWRRGEDTVIPMNTIFSSNIANTDKKLFEQTRHNVIIALNYSPKRDDFQRVIPQAQLFWKGAVKGMRFAATSTVGAQVSLIF